MTEVLLIGLALLAIGITAFGAIRISAFHYSQIVRGIMGGALGLGIELGRVLIAFQIINAFAAGNANDITAMLANLRLFNIPILIGIGFFAAYAGEETTA